MNWHFCIDNNTEKRALSFCYGAMNSGTGKGCGDGFSDEEGYGFGGPYSDAGDGRLLYSTGIGTGSGEGNLRLRGGLVSGNGSSPKTWF